MRQVYLNCFFTESVSDDHKILLLFTPFTVT